MAGAPKPPLATSGWWHSIWDVACLLFLTPPGPRQEEETDQVGKPTTVGAGTGFGVKAVQCHLAAHFPAKWKPSGLAPQLVPDAESGICRGWNQRPVAQAGKALRPAFSGAAGSGLSHPWSSAKVSS